MDFDLPNDKNAVQKRCMYIIKILYKLFRVIRNIFDFCCLNGTLVRNPSD